MPIELIWGPVAPPAVGAVTIDSATATVLGTSSVRIDIALTPEGKAYVEYDSALSGFSQSTSVTASFLTSHSITITGLSPGVVYRWRVIAISTDGTLTTGSESTFTTTSISVLGTVYGYGAGVTGGTGGQVRVVDNNDNSGSGSFRDAVSTPGPAIVTFAVDGIIRNDSAVNPRSNITIAGETSGGDGITFKKWIIQVNGQSNVIIRNVRHRGWEGESGVPAANTGSECFGGINGAHHLVFQNLSGSWHADETFGLYRSVTDVTVQDCIFGEGYYSGHNYPLLVSEFSNRVSIFRDLLYRGEYRNPNIGWDDDGPVVAPSDTRVDVANNLIWPGSVVNSYGPEVYWQGKANIRYNYIGNTANAAVTQTGAAVLYQTGNYSRNGRSIASGGASAPYVIPAAATLPMMTDARAAAEYVLDNAGCRVGGLDAYDTAAVSAIMSAGL